MTRILIGLALLLPACAAPTSPGARYRMEPPRNIGNMPFQPMTSCGTHLDPVATGCHAIVTGNPADEEAWMFEMRVKEYVYGMPAGRRPVDYVIAGTRETCEAVRASMT